MGDILMLHQQGSVCGLEYGIVDGIKVDQAPN